MGINFKDFFATVTILLSFLLVFIILELGKAFSLPPEHGGWFYEYQTLIAGILALFAAGITTTILIRQYSFEKKKHREEQNKTGLYYRALLPDALSELISYTKKCYDYLCDRESTLPAKPREQIDVIKSNIRYADAKTSDNLFKIVSFYQVHNARLNSYSESPAPDREKMLYDVVMLNWYFIHCFSYARNEEKSLRCISPDEDGFLSSYKSLIGLDAYYDNQEDYSADWEKIKRFLPA